MRILNIYLENSIIRSKLLAKKFIEYNSIYFYIFNIILYLAKELFYFMPAHRAYDFFAVTHVFLSIFYFILSRPESHRLQVDGGWKMVETTH